MYLERIQRGVNPRLLPQTLAAIHVHGQSPRSSHGGTAWETDILPEQGPLGLWQYCFPTRGPRAGARTTAGAGGEFRLQHLFAPWPSAGPSVNPWGAVGADRRGDVCRRSDASLPVAQGSR